MEIAEEVRKHIELQKEVVIFNRSFGPFLVIGVPSGMLLCLFVFYSVFKLHFDHLSTFLLYVGNGVSFLYRAFLQLYLHSQIKCELPERSERNPFKFKHVLLFQLQAT